MLEEENINNLLKELYNKQNELKIKIASLEYTISN